MQEHIHSTPAIAHPAVRELERAVSFITEEPLAAGADFATLQESAAGVIRTHPDPSRYVGFGYDRVRSSTPVQRPDHNPDTPRLRIVDDPEGEQLRHTQHAGKPAVTLQVDVGAVSDQPYKGGKGSWEVTVTFVKEGDLVRAIIRGAENFGRKDQQPLPFSAPTHVYVATKPMVEWAGRLTASPDLLQSAYTRQERRGVARALAALIGS